MFFLLSSQLTGYPNSIWNFPLLLNLPVMPGNENVNISGKWGGHYLSTFKFILTTVIAFSTPFTDPSLLNEDFYARLLNAEIVLYSILLDIFLVLRIKSRASGNQSTCFNNSELHFIPLNSVLSPYVIILNSTALSTILPLVLTIDLK